MYIRVTKNQRGEAYYHLVESYRDGGKVKQRTLLSLGNVKDGKLEELAEAISKHLDYVSIFNLAKFVDVKNTFIYGPLYVLDDLLKSLGIDSVIRKIRKIHPKLEFDFGASVFTQLCGRFIKPCSKLALYDKLLDRMFPGMVNTDLALHQIYRTLDILAEHKEEIEQQLFYQGKDLFTSEIDVVLYDLTTIRFESTRLDLDSYRRFGYSKEMRSDCTQVVLGLLTDTDGIPLSFEVHPGNTFEGKTLNEIVNKIRNKFSVRRFIFVADRGLFSFGNLEYIRSQQGEFIVGLRMGAMNDLIQQDFYNLQQYEWINENLAVYETTMGEDRCIITWSKVRAERDKKTREDILDKIRKKLMVKKRKEKDFITNTNYKKYVRFNENNSLPELNTEAIEQESRKDGFFGIITNVKTMQKQEVVMHYKQLWKIEDAFGEIKGTLRTRPVFHWTDDRIIGHFVLCFLAYYCEAHITKMLRENHQMLNRKSIENNIIKPRELTAVQAMEDMATVMAVPVQVKNKTIWIRTDIPENGNKLLRTLRLRIPPKIIGST
ncbi:MAG: IS1634 family transposase [Bacteroidota bacterium]